MIRVLPKTRSEIARESSATPTPQFLPKSRAANTLAVMISSTFGPQSHHNLSATAATTSTKLKLNRFIAPLDFIPGRKRKFIAGFVRRRAVHVNNPSQLLAAGHSVNRLDQLAEVVIFDLELPVIFPGQLFQSVISGRRLYFCFGNFLSAKAHTDLHFLGLRHEPNLIAK